MAPKVCKHNRVCSKCVECAKDGTGGASICRKPVHGLSRKFVCVACAQDGTGGKGICKLHGFVRISRCRMCAVYSINNPDKPIKKPTEFCRHLSRTAGPKSEGCSLCQKEDAEKELDQYYRANPPSLGGTPRTPVFEDTSPRA
jgi:hypothetical protein